MIDYEKMAQDWYKGFEDDGQIDGLAALLKRVAHEAKEEQRARDISLVSDVPQEFNMATEAYAEHKRTLVLAIAALRNQSMEDAE